ncbi:hypothetical protein [Pseudoxanthomonas kaohsiungensis]|uniref:Uncharacterized protein n=1 Tax=Pseudoxanthomonas kaohsiungensis TaxID=283923 RepID=A0ABW3LXU0_9GAMM|nr:hypothetical protein [Pseudoxanthomonas kaohsiungensis]KAF1702892.1 hypothetical protein CSC66_08955 [Pseudoxanthomonas kaohsiungensis]
MEWKWRGVHLNDTGTPTVLEIEGVGVVRLMERVDHSWFAMLDYHLSGWTHNRDCSSYDGGRRGAEMWAQRHQERLLRQVREKRAEWARLSDSGTSGKDRLPRSQRKRWL